MRTPSLIQKVAMPFGGMFVHIEGTDTLLFAEVL